MIGEYRRAQAMLRKCEGRTHKAIAMEHGVNERTVRDGLQIITKKELKGWKYVRVTADQNPG